MQNGDLCLKRKIQPISPQEESPSQLTNLTLWWKGPTWLSQPSESWPVEPHTISVSENLEERPAQITNITSCQNGES